VEGVLACRACDALTDAHEVLCVVARCVVRSAEALVVRKMQHFEARLAREAIGSTKTHVDSPSRLPFVDLAILERPLSLLSATTGFIILRIWLSVPPSVGTGQRTAR
jgi:hypothetical protein